MLFSYDIMYTVYIRLLCKYNTILSEAGCHIQIRINYMLGNKTTERRVWNTYVLVHLLKERNSD